MQADEEQPLREALTCSGPATTALQVSMWIVMEQQSAQQTLSASTSDAGTVQAALIAGAASGGRQTDLRHFSFPESSGRLQLAWRATGDMKPPGG